MHTKLAKLLVCGAAAMLLGAGCATSAPATGPDGGFFKSVDGGTKWEFKGKVLTTAAAPVTMSALDINVLATDPKDSRSMWAGTTANGIFYSLDAGESWQQVKNFAPAELQLTSSIVNGIAVDPENKCIVYATITAPSAKSYLIRTNDCSRSWGVLYTFNELKDQQLRSIAINPTNSKQLLLGDTAGDIFRSNNAGGSWETVTRFDGQPIRNIVIHPNGQAVFVGTSRGGVKMSYDAGTTWGAADLKMYRGADEVYTIALDAAKGTGLLLGTKYGILRSDDLGKTWMALELLTGPQETQILSIAVNPKNSNKIYYGTPKGFYRTDDGGKTWATKRIPTSRIAKTIWVDVQKVGAADVESVWFGTWRAAQ
jgi:hypothetical protein